MAVGIASKKSLKIIILAFLCCSEAQLKETLQCNVHVSKVVKLSGNLVFEIQTSMTFIIQFSAPMANCWPCFHMYWFWMERESALPIWFLLISPELQIGFTSFFLTFEEMEFQTL